jgi:ribonuclease HII
VAIIAGIDEAGLGPLLGPLVVSATVFRVPDRHVDRCMWQALSDTCTQTVSRSDRRLAIADSKVLFKSRSSLAPLERAALVMLAVSGKMPTTWHQLLETIAPTAASQLEDYPWYTINELPIPIDPAVGDIPTRANAIRRNCSEKNIELLSVFSEPLLEKQFNRMIDLTNNKATVLIGLATRLIDKIIRCSSERRVRICVDRLGGRTHYRDVLQTSFPEYDIQVLEESTDNSLYRLENPSRVVRISFSTSGEQKHLPVALASAYSKYLRELFMHVFNGYWSTQVADLKPTAGYYTDAKRWLTDVAPTLKKLAVKKETLIRQR